MSKHSVKLGLPLLLVGAALILFTSCRQSASNNSGRLALLAALPVSTPLCTDSSNSTAGLGAGTDPTRVGAQNLSTETIRREARSTGTTGTVRASSGEVIENRYFSNPTGTCLLLDRVTDVVVRGNHFHRCKQAIEIMTDTDDFARNIRIEDNFLEKPNSGIHLKWLGDSNNGSPNAENIVIHNNRIEDIQPPVTSKERHGGAIGYQSIRGCGLAITNNTIVNRDGESAPSDLINLFMSAGLEGDPIRIDYNLLRGGLIPTEYHTESTGGIVLGDGCVLVQDENGRTICDRSPTVFAEYQQAVGNVVIDPGKNGIGIAGGRNIRVEDNIVYGRNTQHWASFGLAAYDTRNHNCNVYGPDDPGCIPYDPKQPTCANITIKNNRLNWWLNQCVIGLQAGPDGTCGPMNDQWRNLWQYRIWPNLREPLVISYCGPIDGTDHDYPHDASETNIFEDTTVDPADYPD